MSLVPDTTESLIMRAELKTVHFKAGVNKVIKCFYSQFLVS